jgi:hypothetical protein
MDLQEKIHRFKDYQEVELIKDELLVLLNSFERMITQDDQNTTKHDLGAFYTPDFITRAMTSETIEGYILKQANDMMNRKYNDIDHMFVSETADNLRLIYDNMVDPITVLDNAVGLGQFLVAACEILLDLKKRFKQVFREEINEFNLVREIIERNLFGVDISESAVEFCRLRCLLILVEYMDPMNTVSLPNLEFNVIQGNTLLGFDFNNQSREIEGIEELNDRYLDLLTISHKLTIDSKWLEKNNTFHWNLHFPRIKMSRGFDIILGNPPWGSRQKGAKMSKDQKEVLKKLFPNWGNNLYGAFWSRTLDLLKTDGWGCYVTPSTMMTIKTITPLRKLLLKNTIRKIILLGDGVFKDAPAMGILVVQIEKSGVPDDHKVLVLDNRGIESKNKLITNPPDDRVFKVEQEIWNVTRFNRFIFGISVKIAKLFTTIHQTSLIRPLLGEGKVGLQTSDNQRFLRKIEDVSTSDIGFSSRDFCSSGKKWAYFAMGRYMIDYLLDFKKVVLWKNKGEELREQAKAATNKAYIRNESYYFKPGGICFKGLGIGNFCAAELPENCIFSHSAKTIFLYESKLKYLRFLLGYFNSFIARYFIDHCINSGKNVEIRDVEELPIQLPGEDQLGKIDYLVNQALTIREKNKQVSIDEIQGQIDDILLDIFSLEKKDFKPVHLLSSGDMMENEKKN